MEERQAHFWVLVIVLFVGIIAILALFSTALTSISNGSVTGAAVKGAIATLCKDADGLNAKHKGVTQVFYGSQFPDQCYDDIKTTKDPVNTGQYLREYVCEKNEVAYHIYDCGSVNSCQFGACVGSEYYKVK
ncbi:hypothetical protein HZA99_06530 [Candidatus Woesearchaeota archaeon]|nr:hypothetical protein [Candidatus Woesearchaeota archaeon]